MKTRLQRFRRDLPLMLIILVIWTVAQATGFPVFKASIAIGVITILLTIASYFLNREAERLHRRRLQLEADLKRRGIRS